MTCKTAECDRCGFRLVLDGYIHLTDADIKHMAFEGWESVSNDEHYCKNCATERKEQSDE